MLAVAGSCGGRGWQGGGRGRRGRRRCPCWLCAWGALATLPRSPCGAALCAPLLPCAGGQGQLAAGPSADLPLAEERAGRPGLPWGQPVSSWLAGSAATRGRCERRPEGLRLLPSPASSWAGPHPRHQGAPRRPTPVVPATVSAGLTARQFTRREDHRSKGAIWGSGIFRVV